MDTRASDLLRTGDQIITSRNEIYTILKGAVGLGGSGVVYPARREGSDIHYVLKESFPAGAGVQCRLPCMEGRRTVPEMLCLKKLPLSDIE